MHRPNDSADLRQPRNAFVAEPTASPDPLRDGLFARHDQSTARMDPRPSTPTIAATALHDRSAAHYIRPATYPTEATQTERRMNAPQTTQIRASRRTGLPPPFAAALRAPDEPGTGLERHYTPYIRPTAHWTCLS